jgi:hypothetical protein
MLADLTDRLPAMPKYVDPTEWTTAKLRAQLDVWGIKCQWNDGKAKLAACLFCHDTEGNPTFGVTGGNPWYRCHRSNKCDKRWSDVQAHFAPKRLATISLESLPSKYPQARGIVVEGLIRRGDVVNLVGGPKARKSFLVMQLGLNVATGTDFLGRRTRQGKVLLIDNELRGDDLGRRAQAMASAMGLDWHSATKNIDTMLLRGQLADLNTIKAALATVPAGTYSLVVVDALYKAMPRGTDENSNADITQCYILLDGIAENLDCAAVCVHHTSKGAQHAKSVTDMGAGAGAQSRSADVHVVLRDHEDANTVVLAAVVRSQVPVDPICIEFVYPLWRVAPEKNPIKVAVAGKKHGATVDALVATIPATPAPKSEILAASKAQLGLSRDSLRALLRAALDRGLVEITVPTSRAQPHLISRKA